MQDTGLIKYDSMCRAITEAHQVDEVKDIRHKAMALERYAAQAMNMEAERKASEIRLRAERRAGELLADMKREGERPAGRPQKESNDTTLSDLGITRDQSSQWQKLANVPETQFEDALRNPTQKPTTAGIIRKHNGSNGKMNDDALWIWGRLRDFEQRNMLNKDVCILAGEMTDAMRSDILRISPNIRLFLNAIEESIND